MQRLRLTFAKTAAMKYTGHLDTHLAWERAFRRARLPLAYTQGFSPGPRIQLAAALPLGFTSTCEVADIWVEETLDLAAARAALEPALPPGLRLLELAEAPLDAKALQTLVRTADYTVTFADPRSAPEWEAALAQLLAQPALPRVRRDKDYDLRPLIDSLEYAGLEAAGHRLRMRLAARESATGRPEEVLAALGLDPAAARYERTGLAFA